MSERVSQSVLVVDDSADIHRLVSARLRSEGVTLLHAHNAEEGLGLALQHLPDLILLDLEMPGTDGMALCRQIMEDPTLSGIPVIFLTGTIDVATKVQAFELGAVDYVTKPFDAFELKARVRSALRTKRYHDLLTTKAQIDALTGLWNRGYLDDRLAVELSAMARQGGPVSLIMLDIDHFKSINDTHGHPFGDLVIQRIAEVLGRASRDSDIACRYGGEEFAIILRNTATKGALVIAERLREEIAAMPLRQGRDELRVTASFGIAGSDQFDDPSQASPETLLTAADQALYGAKSNGRNRVEMRHTCG
ncbi:diguanylate cyclase [Halomonas ramblicola]|uniref:diguanylate cyclase n=1 Tax=Halomonas ramblicola TaxID=747349 RepID=UPI0025B48F0D|nr:diguanylate cyclase [Halomonas ramblicola]MDN3522597.1 diguanylate cyclase [Halomonas ramblicola]